MLRSTAGPNPFMPPIRSTPPVGALLFAALMLLAAIGTTLLSCPAVSP